jgi:dTDP-4-dehydrorhamnose reductase
VTLHKFFFIDGFNWYFMANILVTGSTGLLGCSLVPWLRSAGHQVMCHGFNGAADFNVDLCDFDETREMLRLSMPDCVINLVALANVDTCQSDPHRAYLLNVLSVENLSRWMQEEKNKCHLIQISTDQIYDGTGPQVESDVSIKNIYAFSKIAAEIAAARVPSSILRTNFFGRSRCSGRVSFSDWLFHGLQHSVSMNVFEDVLFSPLSLNSLVRFIEQVVQKQPLGVFNLGARNGFSKADFAFYFAQELGLSTDNLHRTALSEMSTQMAYRPKDMRMDSSCFETAMGVRMPELIDEIKLLRSEYFE